MAPQKDTVTLSDFKVQKLSKYLPKVMPAQLAIKTDELLTQLELEGYQTTVDLAFLSPQWIDKAIFPDLLLGKPYESTWTEITNKQTTTNQPTNQSTNQSTNQPNQPNQLTLTLSLTLTPTLTLTLTN